ncbi:MAG: DUF4136 domain-containing protein [bacterium]
MKISPISKRYSAVLVLASLAACAGGIEIQTDFDSTADFAAYETWNWVPAPAEETGDPGVDDPIARARIRGAVEDELNRRGYRKVANAPDFLVNYYTALKDEITATEIQDYYDRWQFSEFPTDYTYTYTWHRGTLMLDLIDAETKRLVWRGIAQAEVNLNDPPEKKKERIGRAVARMLEEFPPE